MPSANGVTVRAIETNTQTMSASSPFSVQAAPLPRAKFADPAVTADGEARASVDLRGLETLWFNTGTLCNLACKTCYIESSPTNDALVYLTLDEVRTYLDEIARDCLPTREIAFTGGEPFMNRDMVLILELCLGRGYEVLVLTNAMRPMRRFEGQILALTNREKLVMRVSLDHFTKAVHEAERGPDTWDKALDGINWLSANDFQTAIAGRQLPGESEAEARAGYAALFAQHGWQVDANDLAQLVLFPEMDATADTPEITTSCWEITGADPASIMCASSRMVIKRKGAENPVVAACTLLPYDDEFTLGETLADASRPVALNHPHCSRFCVLGGATCSA
ncbi:radical SAM protein [Altererythrobacter sp. MF3-039]|uniref:radical SAM protein n=1 Tax=Altererythrobacter sp. MF3-039 TaxID=3252901 RepID=UPI00390C41F8